MLSDPQLISTALGSLSALVGLVASWPSASRTLRRWWRRVLRHERRQPVRVAVVRVAR